MATATLDSLVDRLPDKPLVGSGDLARVFGVVTSSFLNMAARGEFPAPAFRLGGRWVWRREVIVETLRRLESTGQQKPRRRRRTG